MEFCNYKFIKVGRFSISDKPLNVTYNGKQDSVSVELKLDHDEYRDIGESVYLVLVNDAVKYVGEYSKSLSNRWIKRRKDNYIWHHQDINIAKALNERSEVLLYLLEDPFITHPCGIELNVSKAIEHDILQRAPANLGLWNKRNTSQAKANYLRLNSIIVGT